jgi:hypothetical protein
MLSLMNCPKDYELVLSKYPLVIGTGAENAIFRTADWKDECILSTTRIFQAYPGDIGTQEAVEYIFRREYGVPCQPIEEYL